MAAFMQAVAGVLIAVVLCCVVGTRSREMTVLLSIAMCCMLLAVAAQFLAPVVELLHTLQELCDMDDSLLQTMLKAVGVGLIAQMASLVCKDSGNSALGKAVELLAAAAVLWLTVPLMTALLELVQQIAGEL